MKCLIVSRTWAGNGVCVGALARNRSNLRLTDQDGYPFLSDSTPYEIGQVWDIEYTPATNLQPPHVEDVVVTSSEFSYTLSDLASSLASWVPAWRGGVRDLFEGKVKGPTARGSGYIQDDIPSQSVGFWIPDKDLVGDWNSEGKRYYFWYEPFRIPHVGVERNLDVIPEGALVRVSLARWYRPDDADEDFPERCYLQISGCYGSESELPF